MYLFSYPKAPLEASPYVGVRLTSGSGSVMEARNGGTLVVAINVEAFLEELVGKDSGLQKSVNAATNFKVDPAVADAVGKILF